MVLCFKSVLELRFALSTHVESVFSDLLRVGFGFDDVAAREPRSDGLIPQVRGRRGAPSFFLAVVDDVVLQRLPFAVFLVEGLGSFVPAPFSVVRLFPPGRCSALFLYWAGMCS